jgi:hypothetical protein
MREFERFFKDRITSKKNWPHRSPDLTPADFFLWGLLKGKVYKNTPRTIEQIKAYASIPVLKLWEVLRELNINNTLIKALQNLYGNTEQVKIGNKLSHPFNITKLRQGCCISPTLFKIYTRKSFRMET